MKFVDLKFVLGAQLDRHQSTMATPKGEPRAITSRWIRSPARRVAGAADGLPSSAGMLGTDGGLLFTGKLTGEFIALDMDTGKQLWQFKTGSSINAPPITYTHKGKQYVTILSGRGGSNPNRFAANVMPTGGAVWTFALMPE